MTKFGSDAGQHKEGYATRADYPKGARYEWVCVKCFAELKGEMDWRSTPLS